MSEEIRVLIQKVQPSDAEQGFTFSISDLKEPDSLLEVPGFSLDEDYQPVPLKLEQESFSLDISQTPSASYVVRGTVKNEAALEELIKAVEKDPNSIAVFEDPPISPFCFDVNRPIGDCNQVKELLKILNLHDREMNGANVFVAIVDTGLNLERLDKSEHYPVFDEERSSTIFNTVKPGQAPIESGNSHGTMCAFNVCLAAPRCTLIDCAVIPIQRNRHDSLGFLSDVIKIYSRLSDWLEEFDQQGINQNKPALVVNNSWGIPKPSWDNSVGVSRYIDNLNHPFNLLVERLEEAGADILFAAGNSGDSSNTIYGANSHPNVLCIAGVRVDNELLSYSSRGPGYLEDKKPDLCAYAHFAGSGLKTVDSGTSTACAVASGVIAAIRSVYRPNHLSPAQLRELLRETAIRQDTAEIFDYGYGYGVINVIGLIEALRQIELDI